jgi:hypothetical protein
MIQPSDFCKWSSGEEGKGKPIIDNVILEDYLTEQGFRCMYNDFQQKDIVMVRVIDRRVSGSSANMLYHFLKDKLKTKHKLWLAPLKENRALLYKDTTVQMVRAEPRLVRDNSTTSYIPFSNGIVEVTKAGIFLKEYGEILAGDTCILTEKIIKNTISFDNTDYKKGVFYQFCCNAVGKEGVSALMAALGYMLYTYKDKSNAKMIVFADSAEDDTGTANGGTGKSFLADNIIREIRNVHWEDGKFFKNGSSFKFQGLTPQHEVICIDDIPKHFDKKDLYNLITGSFTSEEKYKPRQVLSFKDSSKIVVTCNYGFPLEGGSDKRRACIIGFTDHYGYHHLPIDDFGHRFFDDWVDDLAIEYQYFYHMMFACIQTYMQKGLKDHKYDEVIKKGVGNSNPEYIINAILDNKQFLIGKENARLVSQWSSIVGFNDDKLPFTVTSVMEANGYVLCKTRKRIDGNPNPTTLTYFEPRC